ncbi:VanZ family protein [Paenibacillus zeisoli]|uniref:VanZ family protein n=1 Tax=Paenibacillus zeisoli TaxID=2496267 RepID=A0A3S1BQA9_9BACL|nr:VanZ family protein [Paenibacillus zeisoli]RUT28034.1 VanZ family protein [Paenibacillus zeisoli]
MFRNTFFQNKYLNTLILAGSLVYALIMIKLLFLRGTTYYNSSYQNYNLIPFKTIKQYALHREHYNLDTWVKNLFGNIILFIPLGVIFPLLNTRYLRTIPFLLVVILVLLAVELIQLFTKVGSFDVDDIILNTFGALIGFVATVAALRSRK